MRIRWRDIAIVLIGCIAAADTFVVVAKTSRPEVVSTPPAVAAAPAPPPKGTAAPPPKGTAATPFAYSYPRGKAINALLDQSDTLLTAGAPPGERARVEALRIDLFKELTALRQNTRVQLSRILTPAQLARSDALNVRSGYLLGMRAALADRTLTPEQRARIVDLSSRRWIEALKLRQAFVTQATPLLATSSDDLPTKRGSAAR